MMLAPKAAAASAEALLFTGGFISDALHSQRPVWIYRDHQGKLQGPFSASNMLQWYSTGRLPQDLLVCGVSQQTPKQALELVPANCFRSLSQLMAASTQGIQYQPVAIAARQAAGLQMVSNLQHAQAARPTIVPNQQGGMHRQQVNMLAAQQAQGVMALPSAVRPAAPQLQQVFRPNVGVQKVVQLHNPTMGMQQVLQQPQQQASKLVMMQQPQQVIITSQQQPLPGMQPVMMQQQQRPVVLQPQALPTGPQLQQQMLQQQVPAARIAAPQQGPGGVMLQLVPQQPSMQLPMQQQGVVRPPGVAGVSMPGAAVAARPGQQMLAQPQPQQAVLQANAAKVAPIMSVQQAQPAQGQLLPAGPGVTRDAAAAHVAQRLEHLAAQAQARAAATGGPAPPTSMDKLGGPLSGPLSGNQLTLLGAVGPSSARSAGINSNNSFNNLDLLVKQANAAAAASGPASAGAPAGLLGSVRTDRRSSAGTGADAAAAGAFVGLHLTPRGSSTQPSATPTSQGLTTGSNTVKSDDLVIDDMLFDLVEDVAVDAGEGPRAATQPVAPPKTPAPIALLVAHKPAGASAPAASSPLPQDLPAAQGRVQLPGLARQAGGSSSVARQPGAPAAGAVPAAQGGLMGPALQAINAQSQQQQQLLLMQAKQQQQQQVGQQQQQTLQQQQQLLRQQQLAQQQQQHNMLQQQQQQQLMQKQQAQRQQQMLQQLQAQQQQLLRVQQQQVPAGDVVMTHEQAQHRQQQLVESAMKQLQAGGDAADTMAALRQLMQQMQLAQQQQPGSGSAAATPASQASAAAPAARATSLSLSAPGTLHTGIAAADASPAASSQATVASPAAPAAEPSTKEFNPWGLSFMDPSIIADVPKTEEAKAPAMQPPSAAAAAAGVPASSPQQGQARPTAGGLTEDEVLAALMPELNSSGLSADQKLGLLKEMLGMQQQQQQQQQQEGPVEGAGVQATPQAPQAAGVQAQPAGLVQPSPPPPQHAGQPNALQQVFQQASQVQPAQSSAADQKPQYVWLQQLASGNKGGADAASTAEGAGGVQGVKAGAKEGHGSEGGDDFDPSMLPADLFDFLDGHNSPTGKAEQGEAGNGRAEGGSWSNTQQQDELGDDGAELYLRPKYVPPGRRPSRDWQPSSSAPRGSGSLDVGTVPPPPPPPPSWTSRDPRGDGRSGSTYVPPHARDAGSSPSPGYGRSSHSSSGEGYRTPPDREREQRIQAQQQMLPPHLRIVSSDLSADDRALGDRYDSGANWPPPPPPQPHHSSGATWNEGPTARRPGYPQHEVSVEEDGKGKLRRLMEAATAGGASALPRQPPPPPPGARRHSLQQHWDRDGHQPQRVPPGFESEFPDGPLSSRPVQARDWEREQTEESYSRGYSRGADEPGEYRRPAWAADRVETSRGYGSSAGYGDDCEGAEARRGRGTAASDRWQIEEDWEQQHAGDRGARDARYGERPARPFKAASNDGELDERGRWYEEHDEASYQYPPPPRGAPRGLPLSPHGRAPPAPPPRPAREPHCDKWDDSECYAQAPPAYGLRQPAPPPPRDGRAGAGSRQDRDRGDSESGVAPRSFTWQQQELLHEYEDDEPAAGAAAAPPARQQPAWQRSGDYWDDHGASVERERHRSPEPGARRINIYGSPPSGAAPQPSHHLRAAAHTAGRRALQPGRDFAGPSRGDMSDQYQDEFPVLGIGARNTYKGSRGYADALAGPADLSNNDAAAAAMAAVAGLQLTVSTAPPRSSVSKPSRKSNPEGGFYAGPQLPSVEETKAAVMAALGSGPGSSSWTQHGSCVDSPKLQDAVQQHAQDSRHGGSSAAEFAEGPAQLRKASSSSSVGAEAPAAPAPRRNVVAATGLFSNVIGQLRRQTTARDSPDAQDGGDEAVGSAESDDAPSSRSSYLSAASGKARRGTPGEANAADIVLAVINSTRQRASKLSNRSRQAVNDFGSAGKADAAWQDASPDTANSCDSSGSAQQEAA